MSFITFPGVYLDAYNIAVGYQINKPLGSITAFGNLTIGNGSHFFSSYSSIAIGNNVNVVASSNAGVSIGNNSNGRGNHVAVGYNAYSWQNSVAIGLQSNAGFGTVSIGYLSGSRNSPPTATNSVFLGYESGGSTDNTTLNTFLGYRSGFSVTSGNRNTIIGGFTGNQGGLDIRTSSNNFVISDGDGNLKMWGDSVGNVFSIAQIAPPALAINGQMVFNLTSDTNLRISVRGTDGVTRVANITLA